MSCARKLSLPVWLSFFALLAQGESIPKQDSAWRRYENPELGYCVQYPKRWVRGDAFEGKGMYFETGVKKFSRPLGEIDIGAFSVADIPEISSPKQYMEIHLTGLQRFERAQGLEVLEQREIEVEGRPALLTKDRYFDPQDRADWLDEILLTRSGNHWYRLELECRADQGKRFEPVFLHFVSTFQLECNRKRSAARP
jgi:hypothetical protein